MESESTDIDSDLSTSKLRELIRVESKYHEDTGRCYDTLQNEYAELLQKYAVALETIKRLQKDNLKLDGSKKENDRDTEDVVVVHKDGDIDKCLHESLHSQTRKLQSIVAKFHTRLSNQRYTGNESIKIFNRLHANFESIVETYRAMHEDTSECFNSKDDELDKLMNSHDDLISSCPLEETHDDTHLLGNASINIGNTSVSAPPYKMNTFNKNSNNNGHYNETGLTNHNIGKDVKISYSQVSDNISIVTSKMMIDDDLLEVEADGPSSEPGNLTDKKGGNNVSSILHDYHEYPLVDRDEVYPQGGDKSSLNATYVKEEEDKSLCKSTLDTLNSLILRKPSSQKDMSTSTIPNDVALDRTKDSGYFEESQSQLSSFISNDAGYPLTNPSFFTNEKSKLNKQEDSVNDESSWDDNKQRMKHLKRCLTSFDRAINNSTSISLVASYCTDKDHKNNTYNRNGMHLRSQNSSSNCSSIASKEKEIYEMKKTDVSLGESFLANNKKRGRNCQKARKEVESIEQKVERLRNDMDAVREVITGSYLNGHSILQRNNDCDGVVDSSSNNEFEQVLQLYAKGNEILERLERKSCDIADAVKSVTSNQEQISFSPRLVVDTSKKYLSQHKNNSRNKRSSKYHTRRLVDTTPNSIKPPIKEAPCKYKRSTHPYLSQRSCSNNDAHEFKHSCIGEDLGYSDAIKHSSKYVTENQYSILKRNYDEFDGPKPPYNEYIKRGHNKNSFTKGKCVQSHVSCTCLPSYCDGIDQNNCEFIKKSEKACNTAIERSGRDLRGKLSQLVEQINQFSSRTQENKMEKKEPVGASHGSIVNDINNRLDNLSLLIAEKDGLNSGTSTEGIVSPESATRVAHPVYQSPGEEYRNDSDNYNGHFLAASSKKQVTAPIIYHHYHTIVQDPYESTAWPEEDKSRRAIRHNEDPSTKRIIELQSPYSLEKANILASYINTLSENMTRKIANDLYYSGPSEC